MSTLLTPPTNLVEQDGFADKVREAAEIGGRIQLEPGLYPLSIDLPNGSKGMILEGAGRNRTFLRSMVKNKPVISANGMWYSRFSDIAFGTQEPNQASAVVDIDGPVDGHGHGVQGNSFYDCMFDGRGATDGVSMSDYALAMGRRSDRVQGSENTLQNCHFIGAKRACAFVVGYNALNNQFIGGNCQQYERCGLEMIFGSFHVFGMGFQSTAGLRQLDNDGWDILAEGGGVGDGLSINGCRTESLRFMKGNGAQPPMITNCNQRLSMNAWWAQYNYAAGDGVFDGSNVYRCLVPHNSGDVWEKRFWKKVDFDVVNILSGVMMNNRWQVGSVSHYHDLMNPVAQVASEKNKVVIYQATRDDRIITVDAKHGPVQVHLFNSGALPIGSKLEVIRGDRPVAGKQEHPVTIHDLYFNNDSVHSLPLTTAKRSLVFRAIGGGTFPRRWYLTGGLPVLSRFVD